MKVGQCLPNSKPRRRGSLLLAALVSLAGICFRPSVSVAAGSENPLTQRQPEAGAPLLRNYSPTEYGGAIQNWAVTQDQRGVIYIGNGEDGILEYDGIRWRRIPTANRTTVRSLAAAPDGRVYVGAVGEFGYLAPDTSGRMQYVSLLERLEPKDRDFADVWRTIVTERGVYFSTFKRLIRVHGDDIRVWPAESTLHLSFNVGNEIYVREAGVGLLRLEDDELRLVPGGDRFANEKVYAILPWPVTVPSSSRSLLIGTRTQGFFRFDGKSLQPWRTDADAKLADALFYCAMWLADGTLAVGTLQGGVLILNSKGELLSRIDKSTGLADDTVFDMFQDRQGGLWLGLDNGLARVDVSAPLTHFGQRSGLDGSIIQMHRHRGTLYAGTTQGLYRLVRAGEEPAHFAAVTEIQGQTWAFLDWGDSLLVGNVRGVFEVRGDKVQLVRPSDQATFSLLPSRLNPDRVFVGMHDGIGSMRWQADRWLDEGAIAGTSNEVRTLNEESNGDLWLGTVTTGVLRLRFADPKAHIRSDLSRKDSYGVEQGLPRSPNNNVYRIAGGSVFATTQGMYRYDESRDRFEPDPRFDALFTDARRQVVTLSEDHQGKVWMYTTDDARLVREAGAAVPIEDSTYRWEPKPLRQISGTTMGSIYSDDDAVVWLGGDNGVYRYDPRVPADYERPFNAIIREVATRSGQFVFGGAGTQPIRQLRFADNALRFEFAAPSFGNRGNRFQVLLEGVDENWSPWSAESYRDYTNIHEGNYRFRVRAMNAFGTMSREDSYEFEILAPWYRTWFAYLCYLVAAAALFAGVTRWRSATLRARNEELAQLVAMRTEELSGANRALQEANTALADLSVTDSLTGLKNRRHLLEHIDSDIAAVKRAHQNRADAAGSTYGLLLVVVDLDHFKQVNDHYGHVAGDRVLQQFAQILRSVCRGSDTAVRWGGEEFLIVARGEHDAESGAVLAERIRSLTASHIFQLDDGKTLRRTCSVGFASYPMLPTQVERFSWEDAVQLADQCLYEAKRSGRNGWVGVRGAADPPTSSALDEDTKNLAALVEAGIVEVTRTPRFDRRASA